MEHNETFWTQRLEVRDDAYVKVLTCRAADGNEYNRTVPSFFAGHGRRPGVQPVVNWHLSDASERGLKSVVRWVLLNPASLSKASDDVSLPVPTSPANPLLHFEFGQDKYLVDAVSLVQRVIALRQHLFTVLMSPFREVVVRSRRVNDVVSLMYHVVAVRRTGGLDHQSILSDTDASCLAYWTSSQERLIELARCSMSILHAQPLYVPALDCGLALKVRGLTDGRMTYVQSVMPGFSDARSRDLLWRDGWSSIRILRSQGHAGQELFDPEPHSPSDTRARQKYVRRLLSDEEVDEVRGTLSRCS